MQGRVLVVDDEKAMVLALKGVLTKEGYQVETASSGKEAIERIETGNFHVVITDLSMDGLSGMDVLERARSIDPDLAVIMITAYGSEKVAVQAMKLGAADYLPKPFDNDELRVVVQRVMDTALLRRDHRRLLEQVQGDFGFGQIVGRSPAMRRLFETVDKIADTDVTVLIRGESGTGKELVANALHYRSPRRSKPMIKMNCAALSRELVESELFGHERGAFTGAIARREGKFEAADGGTLFLDEVGDMPLDTQAKLLRAIQEKEFERVGGNQPIKVDVRVIAATNQNLETAVRAGRFREDLYYRLRVVELVIPPLHERGEDIPLLIDHFLKEAAARFHRDVKPLSGDALRACMQHQWKGNVRELRSAVEQALLLAPGAEITAANLFGNVVAADAPPVPAPTNAAATPLSFREAKEQAVQTFERDFLLQALRRHGGNISKAAEEIGMYRQNFQQKMRELGISAEEAKDSGDRKETNMRFLARMQNLIRGVLGQWLGRREQRNPEAVYEAAIQERLEQYAKLRQAAAGVLYARTKLTKEMQLKSAELARVDKQLDIAVDHDDDAAALALISRRGGLCAEVERLTGELSDLTGEAETAKKNLIAFQREIARLREEKVLMIARLANAQARLRLQETLNGLSTDADIRALEGVRDHINQLVAEVQVARDTSDTDLERRLGKIREAEADAAARAQLDELKRARKRTLLPLVLPRPAAAW